MDDRHLQPIDGLKQTREEILCAFFNFKEGEPVAILWNHAPYVPQMNQRTGQLETTVMKLLGEFVAWLPGYIVLTVNGEPTSFSLDIVSIGQAKRSAEDEETRSKLEI